MSALTEPLKLTPAELEEAAAAVEDLYRWNDAPTPHLVGKLRRIAQCAVEEAEPAGARDDAAELRAAVEAWGDAHRHFRHVLAHPDQGSSEPYLWAEHEFYQAEERLLAALAATEGQP